MAAVRKGRGTERCARSTLRANPLVRVKVEITVRFAECCRRRLSYTAILTMTLTLTLPSEAALRMRESSATAYGDFDCNFGFDSHEWSCSHLAQVPDADGGVLRPAEDSVAARSEGKDGVWRARAMA